MPKRDATLNTYTLYGKEYVYEHEEITKTKNWNTRTHMSSVTLAKTKQPANIS